MGIVGGPLVSSASAQANYIIYHQILYSGATIQGSAEGVAKFVRYNEDLLYRGTFFFIYFTIIGVNKIVPYNEDFVI